MNVIKVKLKRTDRRFGKDNKTKIIIEIEENGPLTIQQEAAIINFFKTL